jgi:hypothetical protein
MTSTLLAGTDPLVHAFFGKVVRLGADFALDRRYGESNELAADAFAARFQRLACHARFHPYASVCAARTISPSFLVQQGGSRVAHHPSPRQGAPLPEECQRHPGEFDYCAIRDTRDGDSSVSDRRKPRCAC